MGGAATTVPYSVVKNHITARDAIVSQLGWFPTPIRMKEGSREGETGS